MFKYLEEGLAYAKENNIVDVSIWSGMDNNRETINFDFLKDFTFIETLECLVPLTKKSKIEGIYLLKNLKSFRWGVDNDFIIDFERLSILEKLNIGSNHKLITNLSSLKNLKELYIQSVKTKDCTFLSELKKLEKVRIINGGFTTLEGIERCVLLKKIALIKCPKLIEIDFPLSSLNFLDELRIERCKILNTNKEELSKYAKNVIYR